MIIVILSAFGDLLVKYAPCFPLNIQENLRCLVIVLEDHFKIVVAHEGRNP